MIIKNFKKTLMLVLGLSTSACLHSSEIVLEYKDTQFFKIEEAKNNNKLLLKLSGLAFHSSLAISEIKLNKELNSLVVNIYLVPAREGLSGSFIYEMPIPDSIDNVKFGKEKIVIWKRGGFEKLDKISYKAQE